METITKADILNIFLSRVHPSAKGRSKLSVHMKSQKPRPQNLSAAAVDAFEAIVHQEHADLDVKAWKTSLATENPSLIEFGQYWLKNLKPDAAKKLLVQLPGLAQKFPLEGEEGGHKRINSIYIEDKKAFKASLNVSIDPGPIVDWNDLPTPRF